MVHPYSRRILLHLRRGLLSAVIPIMIRRIERQFQQYDESILSDAARRDFWQHFVG
jgi:hypothetical protein